MTDTRLLDDLTESAVEISGVADDAEIADFNRKCTQLVELEQKVAELESELSDRKQELNTLRHRTLPDIMTRLNMDRHGLLDQQVDIVLSPYYKAGIPASWDETRRDESFDYLESIGGGDIVRAELTVSAGAGDLEQMRQVERRLTQMMAEYGIDPSISLGRSVHWGTLTSFVREQHESGVALDVDKLGATIGQVVKIKKR